MIMKDYYDGARSFSTYTTNDCPFKGKCTSANSFRCLTCRHNRGKRDYYDPVPWRPYIPYPEPEPWRSQPVDPFKPIYTINYQSKSNKTTPRFTD